MAQSVLVPMDDSQPSKAALKHALSSNTDAEITVLYVIDTTNAVGYVDLFPLAVQNDHRKELGEQLFAEVRDLAADYDVEIVTVTERGIPARTISEFINDNDFDHVIMGSHCRTGVNRLFLGSVAERVVRRSSVPVTIVP